jgi:hypothetical protein
MRTVVLSRPASGSFAPAASPWPSPQAARLPSDSAASAMRTIVLDKPVKPGASPAPRRGATGARKAQELTEKALALLGRGLKAGLSAIAPVISKEIDAEPGYGVSTTAKTQELSPYTRSNPPSPPTHRPAPPPPARAASTQPRTSAPSYSLKPAATGAEPTARLVSRADGTEFRITGTRAVIGRSTDPADRPDINLSGLAHGAERVSRRHAEILKQGSDYFVRDLGSLNGTYVVGRGRLGRDQLYKLKDRDQVVLGSAILEFRKG